MSPQATAKKTIAVFTSATGQYDSLRLQVTEAKEHDGWAWANCDPMWKPVKNAYEAIQKVLTDDPVIREVILQKEVAKLKQTLGSEEEAIKVMRRMTTLLDPLLENLNLQCKMLINQHRARLQS